MGFEEFKKAQAKQDESKFIDETENKNTKSFKDDRFWNITKDGSGNSKSIVRFLPQQDPTKAPYVKTFIHAFQHQDTGRWFVDECPWTVKVTCPICAYANEVWDTYKKPAKQTWYIANILVIKDENNPEAEGKVFLYKFGREIFKKIEATVKGDPDDDISPKSVFNMFEGHNFRINVSSKKIPEFNKAVNDYDKCRFEMEPSGIFDDDEDKMKAVYESIHDLDEFINPDKFKSPEELKKKLASFLGGGSNKSIMDELKEQQSKKKGEDDTKGSPKNDPTLNPTEDDDDDFFSSLDEEDDEDDIPF